MTRLLDSERASNGDGGTALQRRIRGSVPSSVQVGLPETSLHRCRALRQEQLHRMSWAGNDDIHTGQEGRERSDGGPGEDRPVANIRLLRPISRRIKEFFEQYTRPKRPSVRNTAIPECWRVTCNVGWRVSLKARGKERGRCLAPNQHRLVRARISLHLSDQPPSPPYLPIGALHGRLCSRPNRFSPRQPY